MRSRNSFALAKKSGADQRTMSRPGTCVASGLRRMSCQPGTPGAWPRIVAYGVQTRLKTYIVESTTAMTIPWRTPTNATPSAQATASANSDVRTWDRRRSAATSNRLIDAAMMTAARTGWGIDWTRPGTNEEHQQHEARGDEPGQLGLRTGLEGDRGARPAGADREAGEEAGREVGRPDARELLVAVDLVAAPCREAAGGRDGVADGDQRDPHGGREQQRDILERGVGQGRHREALRKDPDDRHAAGGEIEHDRQRDRDHDRDEDAWHARRRALEARG